MQAERYSEFLPTGLNGEFDQLLRDNRLYVPLPTWIPERFNKAEIYFDEADSVVSVFIAFSNDEIPNDGLTIYVAKYAENSEMYVESIFPKDGEL